MSNAVEALRNEKYISLETFKKDGTGVKTPVWVAEVGGKLIVFTDGNSYKVKRVARNSKARIAGCDARGRVHGEWFDATAKLSDSDDFVRQSYEALHRKYGIVYSLITAGAKLSGSFKRRRIIELQA
jgi:PPOX class probable F420-dependent enzyme